MKRDILKKSTIGGMFTGRSNSNVAGASRNLAYGVDGAFGFFENLTVGGYYARTDTDAPVAELRQGATKDEDSFQGRFDYFGDRYGARVEYLDVGNSFNPELGFIQRQDFRRSFASLRFSPRPKRLKGVRKLTWQGDFEHFENGAGALETRVQVGRFGVEFESSDTINIEATRDYEMIVQPFSVARAVAIAPGSYSFDDLLVSYTMGAQRRLAGTIGAQVGQFWNGTIRSLNFTSARISVLKQFSIEPTIQHSRVELPQGDFNTTLLRARTDYAFSPRMFASALVQYSSTERSFSNNMRFRWEFHPGSELFVVYTDEHDTERHGLGALKNRAFVVKVNRLFQF